MKTVRFTEDTKKHDGLSPALLLYDEVTHDFFNRPQDRYKTLKTLKNPINQGILINLSKNLLNLAERSIRGKVPVLPCGGGRNNVVDRRFTKWIFKLSEYIKNDYIKTCFNNNIK